MKKTKRIAAILLTGVILLAACFAPGASDGSAMPVYAADASFDDAPEGSAADFHDRYQLEQMVVLSRHNIRSPLSGNGSALAKLTPHTWFDWTSAPGELSLRGGVLETEMGQFFRKWLVKDGLMTENYIPENDEMYFYANSLQRTVATAQYFSSGMLPVAGVRVDHKYPIGKMDPVFNPQLTFVNDKYRDLVMEQINALGGSAGINGYCAGLSDNYKLLADVIDLKDSEACKTDGTDRFRTDDLEVTLEENKEPSMTGSLKSACQASDALVLQYYEERDPKQAAFGHSLTREQWKQIAYIKDAYTTVLFSTPAVAVNVAHPLLQVMAGELSRNDRKFTYLCGHDSSLASVLASLDAAPYELPGSIERWTPIGSKLVLEKWKGSDGQEYCSLSFVYQSADQLRNQSALTLDTPPMMVQLELLGLQKNADGLYKLSDVEQRFKEAIGSYDAIKDACEEKAAA